MTVSDSFQTDVASNVKGHGAAESEDGTQSAIADSEPAVTTSSSSDSGVPQFKSARLQQLLGGKLAASVKQDDSPPKSDDSLNAENANKITNGDSEDVSNGGNTSAVSNSNGLNYVNDGPLDESRRENAWEACDTTQITLIESKS